MSNKEMAQRLLFELNKGFADSPYVDIPAATEASESQSNRAREGNEGINDKMRQEQRSIEITRHILSIDCDKYNVDLTIANRLAGYIEGNPNALAELKMELAQKKKIHSQIKQKIASLQPNLYVSEIDYIRAKDYETTKLHQFEGRMEYVEAVIELLEDYAMLSFEEREHNNIISAEEDFDFSYMYTHGNQGYQNLG